MSVRELFDSMDKNGDGTLNRREVIIALRNSPVVQQHLGLPARFQQGSEEHTRFEAFFQRLDADDSRYPPPSTFITAFLLQHLISPPSASL